MANIPTASTIVEVLDPSGTPLLTAAAKPSGGKFKIYRTTQVDPYDARVSPAGARMAALLMAAKGETFLGKSRKKAKISLSKKKAEPKFADVKDLIDTFPSHSSMKKQKISKKSDSGRVAEEERNVVVDAWIYAASRESDNDFHLIIGRKPGLQKVFMTMELSGLPPKSAASFAKLNKARNAFKKGIKQLPGTSYDFYDPPRHVEIGGSLFWDASHATGQRPGPDDLRPDMPVVWEVHPISTLKFK